MNRILMLALSFVASPAIAQDSVRQFTNEKGQDCFQFLEKAIDDGGLIVNTLCKQADGEYLNYREWWQTPTDARNVYDSMTGADQQVRAEKSESVSGQLDVKTRAK